MTDNIEHVTSNEIASPAETFAALRAAKDTF